MTLGIVTSIEYDGTEYSVPTSTDQRKGFTDGLIETLAALDGVDAVYNAGTTQSWSSVRLEIILETTERTGTVHLVPNPRSISPRIRNTLDAFVPVSAFDVLYTPTAVNADQDIYENNYYIVEVWFF